MGSFRALPNIGEHPLDMFLHAAHCLTAGRKCALATIVNVTGGFSRDPGALMVICDDGEFAGSVSGGCVDHDVVKHAINSIESSTPCIIQYGYGSKFFDIQLPCGGGIEVLITPNPAAACLHQVITSLLARDAVMIVINALSGTFQVTDPSNVEHRIIRGDYHLNYLPKIRIIAAGRGQELFKLTKLAHASQYDIISCSPDMEILDDCSGLGAHVEHLTSSGSASDMSADPWTAIIFLFHDHDWELPLLKKALVGKAFYIGALGSRKSQQDRLDTLRREGMEDAALRRLIGPIGLIPSTRDASALAISTLAQILDVFRKCNHDAP